MGFGDQETVGVPSEAGEDAVGGVWSDVRGFRARRGGRVGGRAGAHGMDAHGHGRHQSMHDSLWSLQGGLRRRAPPSAVGPGEFGEVHQSMTGTERHMCRLGRRRGRCKWQGRQRGQPGTKRLAGLVSVTFCGGAQTADETKSSAPPPPDPFFSLQSSHSLLSSPHPRFSFLSPPTLSHPISSLHLVASRCNHVFPARPHLQGRRHLARCLWPPRDRACRE